MSSPETFCPYVGLQPYTEAERDYFFGRERDQRVIVSNLYAAPLTVLYGASGVGKSSVLLAGVVPRLRATPRTAIVVFREWQDATFIRALKAACIAAVEQAYGKPLSLEANLPFDELLAQAAQILNGSVVILLDQFEEYFLYRPESRADDSFDAEFARAVNREEVNASFLIALREDGLSKLDRFRTRIPNLLGNTLRLQHLDASVAEDAIRKPLEVYNVRFGKSVTIEDELVREVIRSINVRSADETSNGNARIETPFLQLVMTRLWDEETKEDSSALRMSTLKRLGGAERIVRTHLDRVMARLSESERSVSAFFFDRLVTPSGAKIAQRIDDLISYAKRPQKQVESILKTLSDTRILRSIAPPPDQPKASATRYEIFHDVLAPAILDWRERYLERKRTRSTIALIIFAFLFINLVIFAMLGLIPEIVEWVATIFGVVAIAFALNGAVRIAQEMRGTLIARGWQIIALAIGVVGAAHIFWGLRFSGSDPIAIALDLIALALASIATFISFPVLIRLRGGWRSATIMVFGFGWLCLVIAIIEYFPSVVLPLLPGVVLHLLPVLLLLGGVLYWQMAHPITLDAIERLTQETKLIEMNRRNRAA